MKYQVFGSKSSNDYDIMVFVDQMGTIAQNKAVVHQWESELSKIYSDKPLNVNLGIVQDGVLIQVFKGTVDEVNNSLIDTYLFHKQNWDQQISKRLDRDVDLKIMRGLRIILSLISRTQYREVVKKALQGDVVLKYQTLNSIDLSLINDLGPGKHIQLNDYYKTVAFQLGQMLGLLNGKEYYSKESIAQDYPELSGCLNRTNGDAAVLEKYKQSLLIKINPDKLKYKYETFKD